MMQTTHTADSVALSGIAFAHVFPGIIPDLPKLKQA